MNQGKTGTQSSWWPRSWNSISSKDSVPSLKPQVPLVQPGPWGFRGPKGVSATPGLHGSDSFSQASVLLMCSSNLGSPLVKVGDGILWTAPVPLPTWAPVLVSVSQTSVLKVPLHPLQHWAWWIPQGPRGRAALLTSPLQACRAEVSSQPSCSHVCFWLQCLCPHLCCFLDRGLPQRRVRSSPAPKPAVAAVRLAVLLPSLQAGAAGHLSRSYVSLSQLELRAVYCGLFLS